MPERPRQALDTVRVERPVRGAVSRRPARHRYRVSRDEPVSVSTDLVTRAVAKRPAASRKTTPSSPPALPRRRRSNVLNRHMVTQGSPAKRKRQNNSKKYKLKLLSLSITALFLAIAGWPSLRSIDFSFAKGVMGETTTPETITTPHTDGEVGEETVSQRYVKKYQVGSDLPRTITIPSLQVSSRIAHLSDGNKKIIPPSNINDAGWDMSSGKPGKNVMIITGYVFGPSKHGIFYHLGNMQKGEEIYIEQGDGQQFTYRVVETRLYDNNKVDMVALSSPVISGKPGLNLVSYTTRYDVSVSKYEQQVVVFATLE